MNGGISIEKVYVWLSMIEGLKYIEYENLLKNFNSLEMIYKISKTVFLFNKYLEDFNIVLSKKVYNQIIDFNLKEKSSKIYNFLRKNNIDIVLLKDDFFNDIPLVLFVMGNKKILNSKNIFFILKNMPTNKKIQYNRFSYKLQEDNKYEIKLDNKLEAEYNSKIIILNFKVDSNIIRNIKKVNLSNSLVVFSVRNIYSDMLEEFNLYVLSKLVQKVIVLEAKYESKYVTLIDNILEYGKNIYVVPQSIDQDSNYFSNYLIKCGADVIISIKDLGSI